MKEGESEWRKNNVRCGTGMQGLARRHRLQIHRIAVCDKRRSGRLNGLRGDTEIQFERNGAETAPHL